ncbi:MAG: hypothetical protein ACP5UM_08815 [Anaerolineae bacterium]
MQAFTTTNATKAQVVDALALALEQGELKLLPDPVLLSEMESFEMEQLPSGMVRYSAPPGMHDDCVISLCLAWSGLDLSGSHLSVTAIEHRPMRRWGDTGPVPPWERD